MKVYRIQNSNNIGPYVSGAMGKISILTKCSRMPEPSEESAFKGKPIHSLNFGFSSTESLTNWFSISQLRYLFDMGFFIAVYETSEENTISSPTQIGFNLSKSEKQNSFMTIRSFFNHLQESSLVSHNKSGELHE